MIFAVSKIAWAVFNPANLLLAGLALGGLGLLIPRAWTRRLARRLLLLVALAALAVALLPLGTWLGRPLETRFGPPADPSMPVDGVVVLGGGIDLHLSAARGKGELTRAGDRLLALLTLARRYPAARLVYTGGNASLRSQRHREADFAATLLVQAGLDPERLVIERGSRNTRENALASRELVRPQPGETWLLVTSAAHMPRAVGVFRKAGWAVVAYPVDYAARDRAIWDFDIDFARDLFDLNQVAREWMGLVAYRLLGWTDAFLPAERS